MMKQSGSNETVKRLKITDKRMVVFWISVIVSIISGGVIMAKSQFTLNNFPLGVNMPNQASIALTEVSPLVDIKANNQDSLTVSYNAVATLSWTSTNATSCTASGDWSGSKEISGSESTGNLTTHKTYTITCDGPGGSISDSVTITVATPTNDIKANGSDGPVNIDNNTAVNLIWTSTNATSCTASGDWSGSKEISGSESTGNLTTHKTYTITCDGPGGSISDSVTVYIKPTVNFTVDNSLVDYNTGTIIRWTSTNATSCTASGDWSGSKEISGSRITGPLVRQKTYILTCVGLGGSVTVSVTVNIGPAPPPSLAGTDCYKDGFSTGASGFNTFSPCDGLHVDCNTDFECIKSGFCFYDQITGSCFEESCYGKCGGEEGYFIWDITNQDCGCK